ncbi:MAG: anthranilate phosphoribosyltransferase [Myxococcota bacterium]
MELRAAIARVVAGGDLTADEMADAMRAIMDGRATPAQIAALVVALRMKGERVSEIVGAARVLREKVTRVRAPDGVVLDTCGTGGDGAGTINLSTLAAIVVASCGVVVAKHGNRAASSKAGSADLLEALGVRVDAPVAVVERCLREIGIGFLFAPALHLALKHAAPVRREIGVRTIFNLLGPLANPAFATHQLVGLYDGALLEMVARALGDLGVRRAWVLHGRGLDEVAPDGPTDVVEIDGGAPRRFEIRPADAGLPEHPRDALRGGNAADNAAAARAILGGEHGAHRDAVVLNAACALVVAEAAVDLRAAALRAAGAIDSGAAARTLARLVETSRA